MLKVQNFLKTIAIKSNNFTAIEDLKKIYAIKVKEYEDLYILNYDQINSQKNHELVDDCRGLILDKNFDIVSLGLKRFYNYGECGINSFDFENSIITEKCDGSYICIFFHNGMWKFQTRGSLGEGKTADGTPWHKILADALGYESCEEVFAELARTLHKYREYTFICELCSIHNRVVKLYKEPIVYLLGARNKINGQYMNLMNAHKIFIKALPKVKLPNFYDFSSYEDIIKGFKLFDSLDEGVVCWNTKTDERVKIKRQQYVDLHHTINNHILTLENKIRIQLTGETSEIVTYFPEYKEAFDEIESAISIILSNSDNYWHTINNLTNRKDFALKVKDTSISMLLFKAYETRKLPSLCFKELPLDKQISFILKQLS